MRQEQLQRIVVEGGGGESQCTLSGLVSREYSYYVRRSGNLESGSQCFIVIHSIMIDA